MCHFLIYCKIHCKCGRCCITFFSPRKKVLSENLWRYVDGKSIFHLVCFIPIANVNDWVNMFMLLLKANIGSRRFLGIYGYFSIINGHDFELDWNWVRNTWEMYIWCNYRLYFNVWKYRSIFHWVIYISCLYNECTLLSATLFCY